LTNWAGVNASHWFSDMSSNLGDRKSSRNFRGTSPVFYIVAHRLWNVACVARAEVEGSGGILRSKHRHSPRSGQIVLPFIRVGMPVDLPHGLRSDFHDRRGDLGRDGEISCVGDANRPTRAFVGFLIRLSSGTPKFADRTSFGVRANTSLRRKVLLSENEPLGNASRNSQPSGGGPGLSVVSPPGNTKDRPPRRRR
jgi:hypothetical protein